jgi:hypothetical protein
MIPTCTRQLKKISESLDKLIDVQEMSSLQQSLINEKLDAILGVSQDI